MMNNICMKLVCSFSSHLHLHCNVSDNVFDKYLCTLGCSLFNCVGNNFGKLVLIDKSISIKLSGIESMQYYLLVAETFSL